MSVYTAVRSNRQKTSIIVVLFLVIVAGSSYGILRAMGFGAEAGALALIFSGITTFISYWWSDKIVLSISGARPASRKDDFHVFTSLENLCLVARLPVPQLYIIEDSAMNAFATGRDPEHAVICVTTGLRDRLTRSEIEGVLAHELAHVQNYDIRLMSIVAVLVGSLALLADLFLRWGGRGRRDEDNKAGAIILVVGLLLALLSPLIAQLIKLAISRTREYLADATAAKLTRQPEALASALAKLDSDREPLEVANKATAHLYIANPLKNHHDAIGWFATAFSTHPPIAERIKRLKHL